MPDFTFTAGWSIQPFDWSAPRVQVLIEDGTSALVDVSGRVMTFSVTLNSGYAIDTFKLKLDNTSRYVSTNFTYAREVKIYATFNQIEQELLLDGTVEDPETNYTKTDGATVSLSGKDFTNELQNRIVLEIYKKGTFTPATNPYVGEIVRDLLVKYCPSIDGSLVPDTAYQIDYKVFVRMYVWDCIKFLADLISYRFYLNEDKQMIWEPVPTPTLVHEEFTGSSGMPADWTNHAGTWALASDRFAQTNASGIATAFQDAATFTDLLVDTYVKFVSGTRAGVMLRLDGSGNCYLFALDLASNLARLYRVTAWGASAEELMIGEPASPITAGTDHRVRVYLRDDGTQAIIYAFVDNMRTPVISFRDPTIFSASGSAGLWTEDASASFEEFIAANAYLIIEEGFNVSEIKVSNMLSRQKNNVYVEGGYEKFPAEEVFTPSGSTDEITLSYLPSEVRVDVTGESGNPQKGGIKGINDDDATVYWLLDYYAKKIYRRGSDWLAVVTTVTYQRNVPLLANKRDETTFATSGVRDFIQTDKTLQTQDVVEDQAQSLLDRMSDIPRKGTAKVPAVVWNIVPGNYVLVKTPSNELDDYTIMKAVAITINFDKQNGLTYSFTLDNEDANLPLLLNSIENRLRSLERRDIPQALIRIEEFSDSASVQDAATGEYWTLTNAFKIGYYTKLGYYRKLGDMGTGWAAAF